MKNLLSMKNLFEPYRIKFMNIKVEFEKNVYIGKLDIITDKYSNKFCRTIKMKRIDFKLSLFIHFEVWK